MEEQGRGNKNKEGCLAKTEQIRKDGIITLALNSATNVPVLLPLLPSEGLLPSTCFSVSLITGSKSEAGATTGCASVDIFAAREAGEEYLALLSICHGRPALPPPERDSKGRRGFRCWAAKHMTGSHDSYHMAVNQSC